MLCSLCQHGVTKSIGGKPTGATWDCPCGETNCRHIWRCQCGEPKPRQHEVSKFVALKREVTRLYAAGEDFHNFLEKSRQVNLTAAERNAANRELGGQPSRGDYLGLGDERHTSIDVAHKLLASGAWLIEDNCGEDFQVVYDPNNDNELRRAWRLA